MAKPVRPVAPPRALRSNPATFSANAEGEITYQFEALPNWMDLLSDFVDQKADEANAAALVGEAIPVPEKSGQALIVNAAGDGLAYAEGPLAGFRNAIINGNFAVNQRVVSGTVTLAAGAYGHDRWKAGGSGCTYTFATSANVTTLTITAGSLVQVIEGANLFTGTYTLSFTGTAQGKIGAGSFGASGITGSVTGGTNLAIEFNTGTVAQVQLEAGSVATPFERRPVGTELALCQRYYFSYQKSFTYTWYADVAGRGHPVWQSFPVTMRAAPTALAGFSGGVNIGSTTIQTVPAGFVANATSAALGGCQTTLDLGDFDSEI